MDRPRLTTKLEQYRVSRNIKPVELARSTGCSRQHLLRIRNGEMEPTRPMIRAITLACRCLTQEVVSAADLFDIG